MRAGKASAATSLTIAFATFVDVIAGIVLLNSLPAPAIFAAGHVFSYLEIGDYTPRYVCVVITRKISWRTRSSSSLFIDGPILSRSTPPPAARGGAFCVPVIPVPPAIRAGKNSGLSCTKLARNSPHKPQAHRSLLRTHVEIPHVEGMVVLTDGRQSFSWYPFLFDEPCPRRIADVNAVVPPLPS